MSTIEWRTKEKDGGTASWSTFRQAAEYADHRRETHPDLECMVQSREVPDFQDVYPVRVMHDG